MKINFEGVNREQLTALVLSESICEIFGDTVFDVAIADVNRQLSYVFKSGSTDKEHLARLWANRESFVGKIDFNIDLMV